MTFGPGSARRRARSARRGARPRRRSHRGGGSARRRSRPACRPAAHVAGAVGVAEGAAPSAIGGIHHRPPARAVASVDRVRPHQRLELVVHEFEAGPQLVLLAPVDLIGGSVERVGHVSEGDHHRAPLRSAQRGDRARGSAHAAASTTMRSQPAHSAGTPPPARTTTLRPSDLRPAADTGDTVDRARSVRAPLERAPARRRRPRRSPVRAPTAAAGAADSERAQHCFTSAGRACDPPQYTHAITVPTLLMGCATDGVRD